MTLSNQTIRLGLSAALLSLLAAAPGTASGFGVFQQGAKAMGMAGAFTARADDPSAMFHNVGGLAHQKTRRFQIGGTFISIGATDFVGEAPGVAAGAVERSEPKFEILPHFYWVEPLGESWTFGLSVNSPYGLSNDWSDADFSGRFISRMASLTTFDVTPNLAWRATPTLGIGFGVIARASETELARNLASFDPATQRIVDVGEIKLPSDLETGFGYQLGVSSHPNSSWSWGASYRSAIEIDYAGDALLRQIPTGNPLLDDLLAATLPFGADLPFSTALEFPEMASLGVAVRPSRTWLVELDVNWAGWSRLDRIDIRFPGFPALDASLAQRWRDVYNYRLGASRAGARDGEWRFGVSFDETPQPLETLGPILPDGDQSALTLGYGMSGVGSSAVSLDLALMYLAVDERTTRVNVDGFNGTYTSSALLLASTVSW